MELIIKNLGKQYRRDFWGLKDFSLEVGPGILGLLGLNGAGKSTFMRMLATITKPTNGTILWNDIDIIKSPDMVESAAKATFLDFGGGIMLGSSDAPIKGFFLWSGIDWTPDVILKRISFFGIAIVLTLSAWSSAVLFIPSFALALGIWSNSHKLFEVLHVTIFYLAMQKVYAVDYFGANSDGNVVFFIPFSIALIAIAFIGRVKQLQN